MFDHQNRLHFRKLSRARSPSIFGEQLVGGSSAGEHTHMLGTVSCVRNDVSLFSSSDSERHHSERTKWRELRYCRDIGSPFKWADLVGRLENDTSLKTDRRHGACT